MAFNKRLISFNLNLLIVTCKTTLLFASDKFLLSILTTFSSGGSYSSGRGGRNSHTSARGNQRSLDRGQSNTSKAKGGGNRHTAAQHVTRPAQRGGVTSKQSTRNEGRGFTSAGQAWQQGNGNNTSFSAGTFQLVQSAPETVGQSSQTCSLLR